MWDPARTLRRSPILGTSTQFLRLSVAGTKTPVVWALASHAANARLLNPLPSGTLPCPTCDVTSASLGYLVTRSSTIPQPLLQAAEEEAVFQTLTLGPWAQVSNQDIFIKEGKKGQKEGRKGGVIKSGRSPRPHFTTQAADGLKVSSWEEKDFSAPFLSNLIQILTKIELSILRIHLHSCPNMQELVLLRSQTPFLGETASVMLPSHFPDG